MVSQETISKVRLDFRRGMGPAAISDLRGISKTTVKKIRRSNAVKFEYKRRADKQPYPQLGEYREKLDAMLAVDAELARHKRRKWTRLHEELQRQGYMGGYDCQPAPKIDP